MIKHNESLSLVIKHLTVIDLSFASFQSNITAILTRYCMFSHAKLQFSLCCPVPFPEMLKVLKKMRWAQWFSLCDWGLRSLPKRGQFSEKQILFSWLSIMAASLLSFYLESLASANNWKRIMQQIFNCKLCNWDSSPSFVTPGKKLLKSLCLSYPRNVIWYTDEGCALGLFTPLQQNINPNAMI